MKKTLNTTVDLRKTRAFLRNNLPSTVIIGLYFIGLFLAIMLANRNGNQQFFKLETFQQITQNNTVGQAFIFYTFLLNCFLLILVFAMGFCAIGTPVLLLCIVAKGFICGLVGMLLALYCDKGIQFVVFVLIPMQIIFSLCFICACTQSAYLSKAIFTSLLKKEAVQTEIRIYLQRYILIGILFIIGAVMSKLLIVLFWRFI